MLEWQRSTEVGMAKNGTSGIPVWSLKGNEFGLLTDAPEQALDEILDLAADLRAVREAFVAGDWIEAGMQLAGMRDEPRLRAVVFPGDHAEPVSTLVPLELRDALVYQAHRSVLDKRQFRHCRNASCHNWFAIDRRTVHGAHTVRREFCSARCKVAEARRKQAGTEPDAALEPQRRRRRGPNN